MMSEFFSRLWTSDELLAVLLAAVISAIGGIVLRIFTPRGKVAWAVSHQHVFNLQSLTPPTVVFTKEVWVQNVGRARVDAVEIILNFPPGHYDIWPQRQYQSEQTPHNNLVLKFDNLNPREYFTVSLFQIASQPPDVTNVRWAGGVAKQVPMAPQQVRSRAFNSVVIIIFLLGIFSLLYFLLRLAFWL